MTITWDDRGVPTIEADSELTLSHGFGYTQAVQQEPTLLRLQGFNADSRGWSAAGFT